VRPEIFFTKYISLAFEGGFDPTEGFVVTQNGDRQFDGWLRKFTIAPQIGPGRKWITGLQVSANPYVVVLGKPETASSRLDLTQAFNSLGTTIAPKLGGLLILATAPMAMEELHQLSPHALHAYRVQEAASVKMPYTVICVALVCWPLRSGRLSCRRLCTRSIARG
jgi:hypothetical protein